MEPEPDRRTAGSVPGMLLVAAVMAEVGPQLPVGTELYLPAAGRDSVLGRATARGEPASAGKLGSYAAIRRQPSIAKPRAALSFAA